MSKLQLLLLGHFECLLPSGERISLSMRKAEVLLAFLALAPGIRHPRERLINLLWGDRGEEQARNSLRQCLSAIKKSLGDVADLVLQIDRTTVCLKPEMIDIDALEFERLATIAEFESLSDAASLYRGEFLEGISIRDAASQEWLDSARNRFKRQFIEILTQLGQTQLISHDFSAAIKSAERLVAEDALGESGWRLLMHAYSENGDRSHALQAFKRCQQALRAELDVEPEAATLELREQIASSQAQPAQAPIRNSAKTATGTAALPVSGSRKTADNSSHASDHSIAVLPFDNLSGDPEQEYFSDGITDSIIVNLALFPDLQVKSRNSSFAFKEQIKSIGEISEELNVDYLVEGSIRKSVNRIRITVQLIEVASGNQVWGKRYDADLENLFDLEEELSRTIAATVTGQIESDLRRIAIAKSAAGQQAYDLLLSGIYHAYRFNRRDTVIAIEKLNQCLAEDPDNVRAHAYAYVCHSMNYLGRWTQDYQASLELARTHIERALQLAPEVGLVQAFYAEYLSFCGKPGEAHKHLDRALEINPNDTDALTIRANCLALQGNFETSLQVAEQVCRMDPYHPWADWELAGGQYNSGRYQEALETTARLRTEPEFMSIVAIASLVKLGRIDAARRAARDYLQACREDMRSMPQSLDDWLHYVHSYYPYDNFEYSRDLFDCLVQAGLSEVIDTPLQGTEETSHGIAVLPFDNLSGDPEQEYFSDGITDSIILNLSLFPDLSVKSRNASFAFKQQLKSVGEISRELDVDYVVEGSIRKSDNQVRITVQLIEGESGNQVWGKRYDAGLENLFDLEEELSRSIAATVTGQIDSEMQRIAIGKGATNLQAYDLLLAGSYHQAEHNAVDNQLAIEKLNQCLELDPGNARAHVQLYYSHMLNLMDRWIENFEQSRKLAEAQVLKAVSLSPRQDYVLIAHSEYLTFRHRYEESERQLRKLVERNPSNAEAIAQLAVNLSNQGKPKAALEQAELAIRLDPYQTWYYWIKSESLVFCERYEDCLTAIRDIVNPPGFIRIYAVVSLVRLGRLDEAREELGDFLAFCREHMAAMPRTVAEWRQYYRDNAPMADPVTNDTIIDSLVQAGLADGAQLAGKMTPPDSHNIAVLPFDNLSGDPQQEYFSDGISESIIMHLNLFPGLTVKSRNSSFSFKQQIKSLGEISAELDVDYLVEGSLRKSADQIRITVQLVEAASGNQVWGKRYDADLENLFDLEEELSRSIAATVTGQIESDLQRIALAKGAADQQAYDLLLAGIYHYQKFNPGDMVVAVDRLKQCLALDPDNVRAHAQLIYCHMMNWMERWVEDRPHELELARKHALKAIELGPDLEFVELAYAEYLSFNHETGKAWDYINKVLQGNPNDSQALAMKAMIQEFHGDFEAALETAQLAYQLDPYHPWNQWNIAESQYLCGHFEAALETIANTGNVPGFIRIYNVAANVKLGRMTQAREQLQTYLQECSETMPAMPQTIDEWLRHSMDNAPFSDPGVNQDHIDCLVQAGLTDRLDTGQKADDDNDQPSILVLPFKNMSGDSEQEYFSDGITSSLILQMGMFDGLTAKSQNSSFAFKNSRLSSREIAAELEADFIIEGSIRKSGSKVRLSVQLVESENGSQIWGKQYDAELEDILDLEQELSQTVAATISGRIGHALQQSAIRKPAKDLHSYDYLLRGLYHFGKFTARDLETARQMIEKCLGTDPDNATAHINLGTIHTVEILENWSSNHEQSERSAQHHLARALELDPDNSLAHAYMSEFLLICHKDFEQSEFHADKAIELNPTASEGYTAKADLLGLTRRLEEAVPYADKCLQLDPHSIGAGWCAGEVYLRAGLHQKAIKTFRSISHPPASVHALIAICFLKMELFEETRKEMSLYRKLAQQEMSPFPRSESEWRNVWCTRSAFQYEADAEAFFELLVKAGLLDLDPDSDSNEEIPSIAVLPFENMSGDREQAFFSDGITTDIISTLSKFRHLRIVARHSTDIYRDRKVSIAEIASEQNVRYILEGSVRKSGDRIRVNAELIDTNNEQNIWSERYDRDLDDLFAVQDEITQQITLAMKVHLDDGEMALQRSNGTINLKAWELTLTAVDLADTYIRQNILDARAMAKQAIELDPDYSYAWVVLAWTYWQEIYTGGESWEATLAEAEKAVQHALDMNPDDAAALNQSAFNYLMRHDADKTLEFCRRSVELEPGNAEFQGLMAYAYTFTGNFELARVHEQNMRRLCPVMPNWYYLLGGQIEQYDGDLDQAIAIYQKGLAVEPDSPLCRFFLVHALMQKGDVAAAQKLADEIKALDAGIKGNGLVRSTMMDATLRNSFHADLEKFGLV